PGDKLDFGDGHVFEVRGYLDRRRSGSNRILDIGNGRALRIPTSSGEGMGFFGGKDHRYDESISSYLELYAELSANHVPIIKVYPEESVSPRFVVMKKEDFPFTLASFAKGQGLQGEKLKLSPKERARLEDQLVEFARHTWMYTRIGDFRPDQIAYNGKEWVLFDFGTQGAIQHRPLDRLKSREHSFSNLAYEDEGGYDSTFKVIADTKLLRRVNRAIREERLAQKQAQPWFQRTHDSIADYLIDKATPRTLKPGTQLVSHSRPYRDSEYRTATHPKQRTYTIQRILGDQDEMSFFEATTDRGEHVLLKILRKTGKGFASGYARKLDGRETAYGGEVIDVGDDFVAVPWQP
ncbi:MAG: hypothetical protein JST16_01465, partial [Bdellovibrionales bacterium]|nr:hypothetical protein [Bdellovibrionales bacterium]